MEREAAIEILRAHEGDLRAGGIRHAALFGSTARGEARGDSDVDIGIDFEEALDLDVYASVGLCHVVANLFPVAGDVAIRRTLKDRVRTGVERDVIPVF